MLKCLPCLDFDEMATSPTRKLEIPRQVAARSVANGGLQPVALNSADGIHPGGGFLRGARPQEEILGRSSTSYATLVGAPLYAAHRKRFGPDSTGPATSSPNVPAFRTDDGVILR